MKTSMTLTIADGRKVAAAFVEAAKDNGWDEDDINIDLICEYAHVLDKAMEALGIEFKIDLDLPCEEEEVEEPEEITGEDEMESIVRNVDGKRGLSTEDVQLLVDCVIKVMKDRFEGFPDRFIRKMVELEACRITDAWGIEVMDE
jgi:hypothetical protein